MSQNIQGQLFNSLGLEKECQLLFLLCDKKSSTCQRKYKVFRVHGAKGGQQKQRGGSRGGGG